MRIGHLLGRACMVALAALVIVSVLDVPDADAARKRRECLDCHERMKPLKKLDVVHKPFGDEDCLACHDRHGFSQQLTLKAAPPELCTTCHETVGAEAAAYPHTPFAEGRCHVCHNSHASDQKSLLRGDEGGSACLPCHMDIKEQLDRGVGHDPFVRQDCAVCHDAHGSAESGLLTQAVGELCVSCHKDVPSDHAGDFTALMSCTDCHDPHLATVAEPLSALAHAPFVIGDCGKCHADGDDGRPGAPLASPGVCESCHKDIAAVASGPDGHKPAGKDCLTCHKPHSGRVPHLLDVEIGKLCTECHEINHEGKAGEDVHTPFAVGDCTACHDPHGTSHEADLVVDRGELCASCHADVVERAAAADHIHEPVIKDCETCHAPHRGEPSPVLVTNEKALCTNCHKGMADGLDQAHPPFTAGACHECHDVHGSAQPSLVKADLAVECLSCHDVIEDKLRGETVHSPFASGACLSCHVPHAGNGPGLLVSEPSTLCIGCHETIAEMAAATSGHAPAREGNCVGCHDPHGTDSPSLVLRDGAMLCASCHDGIASASSRAIQHEPFAEGNCAACHDSHGEPVVADALIADLCATCHKVDLVSLHGGFPVEGTKCTTCHDPHASEKPGLVNEIAHAPFASGDCAVCHDKVGPDGSAMASTASLCAGCHTESGVFQTFSTTHVPVEKGDCVSCHDPHAARAAGLLRDDVTVVCTECHDGILTGGGGHRPVDEGDCLACHLPHGGSASGLLIRPGEALCFECHTSLKERLESSVPHRPVAEGRCTVCHDPHGNGRSSLVKGDVASLCLECHSGDTAGFKSAHSGFDVSRSDCTTCHDPHLAESEEAKFMRPVRHGPFASGDCAQCHLGEGKAEHAAVPGLCLNCHKDYTDKAAGDGVHAALMTERSCLECHAPHAGFEGLRIRASQSETCFRCHDRKAFQGEHVHKPVTENCSNCHDPHRSEQDALLMAPLRDLCLGCHEETGQHTHPVGVGSVDPRTGGPMTCVSCHNPHASEHDGILTHDKSRDLCIQCHVGAMGAH